MPSTFLKFLKIPYTYDLKDLTQLPLYNNCPIGLVKKLLNSQIVENTDKILSKSYFVYKKNTPYI